MNKELKLSVVDGIAVITLNRPEANNSPSSAILEGLGAAYRRCDEDDEWPAHCADHCASSFFESGNIAMLIW